jgi:23S rRNA (cytosine1962-C5)-methyltransferase
MASNRFPKHLFKLRDLWLALEEAARISGERVFIVAGSQAILASCPEGPEVLRLSTDIDLYTRNPVPDEIQRLLLKELGGLSSFIETHHWEIEPIGPWVMLTALPRWEERLVPTETPSGVVGWCLAPLDIAYNKAEAGRPKDIDYLAGLFKARIVLPSQIKSAMDAAGDVLTAFARDKVNATIQAAIQFMGVSRGCVTAPPSEEAEMLILALARRRGMGLPDEKTNIYRVVDGDGDGLPGVFIDSCDGHWLVQTQSIGWPAWLERTRAEAGWRSLWWKRLEQDAKAAPRRMAGEGPDGPFTVRELGLTCELNFGAGYSQGLFIDQREQKAWVMETVRPEQRVLNLFAYTCAFSVIAASRGAVTTSVDLSRSYLEWGKRNFALNDFDPAAHFFCKGDAAEWLRRFAAKGRTWHGIVLDPPTFSRNDDGRVFRIGKDFSDLVAASLRVLEPGGWLLCSTNQRGMTEREFLALIRRGAEESGRAIRCEPGAMPPDFTGERYLKAVRVRT